MITTSFRRSVLWMFLSILILCLIGSPVPADVDLSPDETFLTFYQDEGGTATQTETVELEITAGERPANVYNLKGFTPRTPLVLAGQPADAKELKNAVLTGIEYILKNQHKDGYWSFARGQLAKGVKSNGFLGTAMQSMNKIVLTSLACMALRRHRELDPERIDPAIGKGLKYVIQKAPNFSKGDSRSYAPWTWAFSLTFLCEEYKNASDTALKADIRTAAKAVVQLILEGQHKKQFAPKGIAKDKKKPATSGTSTEKKEKKPEKRPSNGGYFGIGPSENDEAGREGILIQTVEAAGPAGKGGMKQGDRILEADGVVLEDLDELYELLDSFKPGQTVKVKVLRTKTARPEKKPKNKDTFPETDEVMQQEKRKRSNSKTPLPEDGGWSYYRMGSVSFTTATCLMALLDARDIGIEIPQEALDRALSVIEGLKMQRDDSDEVGFAYHTGVRPSTGRAADVRGSVGRLAVCHLVLLRSGKNSVQELAKGLDTFVNRREELDKVKGYPGNHFVRSFLNAAYYYLYAHFYSAMAVNKLPDAGQRKKVGSVIQEALLKSRNGDGLWTDHEMWGQLYGTSMALMGLGELKELAPSVYKTSSKTAPDIKTGEKK